MEWLLHWKREAEASALPVAEEADASAPQPRLLQAAVKQACKRQVRQGVFDAAKQKNLSEWTGFFVWQREKDSLAFCFPLRGTGKQNKRIRQCLHWLMHMPPACANIIRILPHAKKESHP